MPYSVFDYKSATIKEILEHWKTVTRQSISDARKRYSNSEHCYRVEEAYVLHRTWMLQTKIGGMRERGPRKFGVCGEGVYKTREEGQDTYVYRLWESMIQRCYSPSRLAERPTYTGCKVDERFMDFQKFAEWAHAQVGFGSDGFQLDKDILAPDGVFSYSPDHCVFVPGEINALFTCGNSREGVPVGVSYRKDTGKFYTRCADESGKFVKSPCYATPQEAREDYVTRKVARVRHIADKWKGLVDDRVYTKLSSYTSDDVA